MKPKMRVCPPMLMLWLCFVSAGCGEVEREGNQESLKATATLENSTPFEHPMADSLRTQGNIIVADVPGEGAGDDLVDDGYGPYTPNSFAERIVSSASEDSVPGTTHDSLLARSVTLAAQPQGREVIDELIEEAGDEESIDLYVSFEVELGNLLPIAASDTAQERLNAVNQRRGMLQPKWQVLSNLIESSGGESIANFWLAPGAHIRVPTQNGGMILDQVAELDFVDSFTPIVDSYQSLEGYDGQQIRDAIQATSFHESGIDGGEYNVSYYTDSGRYIELHNPMRIGIIEHDPINTVHLGWNDANGNSRLEKNYLCNQTECELDSSEYTLAHHSTRTAWVAAGSIMEGQDPNVTNPADRAMRSGVATGAEIYYYGGLASDESACAFTHALEQEVLDRVDVVNMSFQVACGRYPFNSCDASMDCCGVNKSLEGLLDAGIVPVAAAGNEGNHLSGPNDEGECSLGYPGHRVETLAAGAIEAVSSDSPEYYRAPVWYDHNHNAGSSQGPLKLGFSYLGSPTTPGVDFSAPGVIENYFGPDRDRYAGTPEYPFGSQAGSSLASPVGAAMVALFKVALRQIHWSAAADARAIMANFLLFGDAYDAPKWWQYGNTIATGLSDVTGVGRIYASWPSTESDLTAPWLWGWRTRHLERSSQYYEVDILDGQPLSTRTQSFQAILMHYDHGDMTADRSNFHLYAYNVCDPNSSEPVLLAATTSDLWVNSDLRKRLILKQHDVAGACIRLRVTMSFGPEGGNNFYLAYRAQGDNPFVP